MTWNAVMGLISTIALSLPILILIATRLAGYKSFPALLAYYIIILFYNLFTEGYIPVDNNFISYFGITNNLLDAPLMLTFLAYFSATNALNQKMKILVAAFVGFEIIVIAIFGFSVQTLKIVMGPGLLLVLGFCLPFFVRYVKTTVVHQKTTGKAMITAAIIFAYGCYSIIYIMYYLMNSKDTQNAFLVYFFVSTFSSVLLSAGIYVESKRVKKLSELKVVRRELSELYPNDKMAAPLRPAIFDFDKEQWN